jgi:hypothetical protein
VASHEVQAAQEQADGQETQPVQIPGAPSGVTMRAAWVTPEMAAKWLLESETRQRSKRGVVSSSYGRDMAEGRWKFNGETVVFDKDHNLMQGQHRLEGVEKSGVAVLLLLVEGVEPDVMDTFDTGLPRYYHDMLKVKGLSYSVHVASISRAMWAWDRGRYMMVGSGSSERPSRAELDAYLEENLDSIQAAAVYAERIRSMVPLPASVTGSAVIILNRINAEAAGEFFNALSYGVNLGEQNPILVLRNHLIQVKGRTRQSSDERRAMLFGAWNAWRAGELRDRLQPWRGQLSNKNYPVPK